MSVESYKRPVDFFKTPLFLLSVHIGLPVHVWCKYKYIVYRDLTRWVVFQQTLSTSYRSRVNLFFMKICVSNQLVCSVLVFSVLVLLLWWVLVDLCVGISRSECRMRTGVSFETLVHIQGVSWGICHSSRECSCVKLQRHKFDLHVTVRR
jgi:hypothetical protein